MTKKKNMIWVNKTPWFHDNKWEYKIVDEIEVIVLAIMDGYAMVRRPRCMPFVISVSDLKEIGIK
jgi:hypothetical protein